VKSKAGFAAAAVLAGVAGWTAQSLYSRHAATDRGVPATPTARTIPATDGAGRSAADGAGRSAAQASDAAEEAAMPAPERIPDRLPNFTLAGADGKPTPISGWTGKSLLLNFWATWCAPCRREIPLLETLRTAWRAQGFEVIGIAVDRRPDVLDFAQRLKIDYPLLIGEEDALDVAGALGFDSPAFPFTVFTDRQSRIVALFVGELHPAQAELILGTIQRVNSGQMEVAAARSAIFAGLQKLH